MKEMRIFNGTVKPLVGHFDGDLTHFICDDVITLVDLMKATTTINVYEVDGYNSQINLLPSNFSYNYTDFTKFNKDTDFNIYARFMYDNGDFKTQWAVGNDNDLNNLSWCGAWGGAYNYSGGDVVFDIELKNDNNNQYYQKTGHQPSMYKPVASWLCVYDNNTQKHWLCEPSNVGNLGVLTDFKITDDSFYLNYIYDTDYYMGSLIDVYENNEFLSIKKIFDMTQYVNYELWSDSDDGTGNNPGQTQNDDNVGGDGDHDNSSDKTDSSDYYDPDDDSAFGPQLNDPDWNSGTPLYTLFKMTFTQVGNLITYLCSNTWQSAVTNLGLGNVFGAIAKCITVPFDVTSSFYGFSMHILGTNTNVATSGVVAHLQTVDCGTITIDRYFGDFKDYAPYTKCYIYLPYIGVNEISLNQVQGKALSLVYGVDLLDGSCVARLSADDKQLYSFSGNCATEYPIVGKSVSSPLAAATNLLGNITGSDTLAATAGLLGSVLTSQNSSSTFQTVGGVAGNWGNVGVLTPFVYLERPVQSRPNAYESQYGYTCNKYLQLSTLSGYTEVDDSIHLAIAATEEEKERIMEYLTSGFYINSPEP